MKNFRTILALLIFFGFGMTVQKTDLVHRVGYLFHEPSCTSGRSVGDNVCGNAICIFSSKRNKFMCISQRSEEKLIHKKVDQSLD